MLLIRRTVVEDDETEFYSPEETAEALHSLTQNDIAKLLLFAKRFVHQKKQFTEEDMFEEALIRSLEGTRRWNKKLTITRHLIGVMRSLSDFENREKKYPKISLIDDISESQKIKAEINSSTTDSTLELETEEILHDLPSIFKDDQEALQIFKLLYQGYTRKKISNQLGLSLKEYDTKRRFIQRNLSAYLKQRELL